MQAFFTIAALAMLIFVIRSKTWKQRAFFMAVFVMAVMAAHKAAPVVEGTGKDSWSSRLKTKSY